MIEVINPGGLPYVPTPTDFQWSSLGAAVAPNDRSVPYNIEDELGLKLPINDQGQSTSCGGQAFSKYNAVRRALRGESYDERSASYTYRHTAIVTNGIPQGSTIRDNASLDINKGICSESLCVSYINGNPPTDAFILGLTITQEMYANASLSQGESYSFVDLNIDSVAQAIKHTGGVVILLSGENNGTWFSEFPQVPTYRQWGHFMYFGKVRMINGKYYIGGIQSWGRSVGNHNEAGWQWFGEEWFTGGWFTACVTISGSHTPVPPTYQFTRDLTVGSRGADVKLLQIYLRKNGFPVVPAGQETTYFGTLTKTALGKFQAAKGIKPSVGYFGPLTRNYVNTH